MIPKKETVALGAIDLKGCWAKLARAEELRGTLASELDRVGSHLRFSVEVRDGFFVRVHVKKPLPLERWGVLIGEIVHDLRSALDHLTWELTIANSGPPPANYPKWWRQVEFPIYTEKGRFLGTKGQARPTPGNGLADLQGVAPSLIPRFQALQPFNFGVRPEHHPLAILHALSIHDKHRALPLVAIVSRPGVITSNSGSIHGRSRALRVPAPIEDGAVIARLKTFHGVGPSNTKIGDTVAFNFKVKVDDIDIGFASGPPAFGGKVVESLRRIHRAVLTAIRSISDPRLFDS